MPTEGHASSASLGMTRTDAQLGREEDMTRKRTNILGLPIGPRKPSLARRAAPLLAGAAVGLASAVAARPNRTNRSSDPAGASADARSSRAEVQSKLKAGDIDLEEVFRLADRDDTIGRTRVKVLLQNLPGVGSTGAVRAMEEIGIDASRRVRGLGSGQREALVQRFEGSEDGSR